MRYSDTTEKLEVRVALKDKIKSWVKDLIIAFIIAMIIRALFIQAFRIPSESMVPTLLVGDHILVEKVTYRFREPSRGDVVVFKFPLDVEEKKGFLTYLKGLVGFSDGRKDYIKRVIGLPGDSVEIRNKVVYINGKPIKEPYVVHLDPNTIPSSFSPRDFLGPIKVPKDSYFVMGDNRDNSYDSRFWGFVPRKDIVGRAFIIYFSWNGKASNPKELVRWQRIGKLIR